MWNAAIQRFEYTTVTEISKYETIANDFPDSRPWRHSHEVFSHSHEDGLRNYMRGPSLLSLSFYSRFTLRIYTATNGLDGGAQTDFAPGRRKP